MITPLRTAGHLLGSHAFLPQGPSNHFYIFLNVVKIFLIFFIYTCLDFNGCSTCYSLISFYFQKFAYIDNMGVFFKDIIFYGIEGQRQIVL